MPPPACAESSGQHLVVRLGEANPSLLFKQEHGAGSKNKQKNRSILGSRNTELAPPHVERLRLLSLCSLPGFCRQPQGTTSPAPSSARLADGLGAGLCLVKRTWALYKRGLKIKTQHGKVFFHKRNKPSAGGVQHASPEALPG